ncbi:MAG TPA: cation-translocating P-type ATPase, partial [Leptolyngbyaceae cyanobacterium M65_K2018_010]|nr:cation-translocating P-type ATPase [Leptolyngbyaceae cyanobacterium M65_K2018_010]
IEGFLAGLTLAMAILPNEIPVVLTIFLALGAWRFSQQQVLTRRVPVVETLGSATVLCVDKIGTLTQNQMAVQQLFVDRDEWGQPYPTLYDVTLHAQEPLPEAFHPLIEFGILASRRDPFDPMEKALQQVGQAYLAATEHLHGDWQMRQEYPLSRELLAMSCVWESPQGELTVAAKGAPEAIADLCHFDRDRQQALATLNTPNPALWWVLGGGVVFLGLILYVPLLQTLFSFSTLHPIDLALCVAAGGLSTLWFELLKLWPRRK